MLSIQRTSNGEVVFTLSGRIEIEDVPELQRLLDLETGGQPLAFDLQHITIVDREAVKFLASCEGAAIRLANCPGYVREWIDTEGGRGTRPRR
jgi:anti-anti-sigma regulatory factor